MSLSRAAGDSGDLHGLFGGYNAETGNWFDNQFDFPLTFDIVAARERPS